MAVYPQNEKLIVQLLTKTSICGFSTWLDRYKEHSMVKPVKGFIFSEGFGI